MQRSWARPTARERRPRDPAVEGPLRSRTGPGCAERRGGKDTSGGAEIPAPIVTFNAQPNVNGVVPPDPNGAVGPNHVVTMCQPNSSRSSTRAGHWLFGPANNNTLWAGFGGDCQTDNSGDPVVLTIGRLIAGSLPQFTASGPTFFECVAVSPTNDPTGLIFVIRFDREQLPDYPKACVWPDAYYFSTREVSNRHCFAGVGAYALIGLRLLRGSDPQMILFLAPPHSAL